MEVTNSPSPDGTNSLRSLNQKSSTRIVVRRIERIIEKYSPVWRVLHEPIQNAIDAIQKRDDVTQGEVTVKLDLANQRVSITDNGRGFPRDLKLLLPDATDKDAQRETMGYQGVGLKSVVYTSSNFELRANTGEESWGIEISDADRYLSSGGEEEAPIDWVDGLDQRGTSLEIEFTGQQVTEALTQVIEKLTESETNFQMNWPRVREENYYLKKANGPVEELQYLLEYYMRTQTYVGSTNRLTNCRLQPKEEIYAKPVNVKLSIDFSGTTPTDFSHLFLEEVIQEIESGGEVVEVEMDNKFVDFQARVNQILQENPKDISFDIYDFDVSPRGIPSNPMRDQAYVKILTPDYSTDSDDPVEIYEEFFSILKTGDDDHFERMKRIYSDYFENVLSVYIMIGRMDAHHERFIGNNYGIKVISANGVPTAHELTPRSSNQSFYFNPITFILNVDAKLNEGKKELVDESITRKSRKYFRDAFEATLNRLSKSFVQTTPQNPDPPTASLVDKDEIKIEGVDFTRVPYDENSLIALFYQLLAKDSDKELPTYGLLSAGIFDGKFIYKDDNIKSDNDLLDLEFKLKLRELVNNFDNPNSAKLFHECDLAIVWEDSLTAAQQQDWRVVNKSAIPTHHISSDESPSWVDTYLRGPGGQEYRPIIVVRELVDELQSKGGSDSNPTAVASSSN